jgi:hypothetical protein
MTDIKDYAAATSDTAAEALRRSTQNAEAANQAGAALSKGFQEVSREWMNWATAAVDKNREALLDMAQCRSPQQLVQLQARLLREYGELYIVSARRITEVASVGLSNAGQNFSY